MYDLCSQVFAKDLIEFSAVNGPAGLQSGIIVNDEDQRTILVQTISNYWETNPYPNTWDENIPGMIHYCATRKGVSSSIHTINLESRLNRFVNLNIYPIYIFVRYPDKTFRFMGEFVRLPEYDERKMVNGYEVYVFALISKNVEAIEGTVREIKSLLK